MGLFGLGFDHSSIRMGVRERILTSRADEEVPVTARPNWYKKYWGAWLKFVSSLPFVGIGEELCHLGWILLCLEGKVCGCKMSFVLEG